VSSPAPLLAARGTARKFGKTAALEPVELEIWDGDALALVGPNGAGKSTLLSVLAGALAPSEGHVERRKGVRVGWAPQRPAQYGRLSARENLELFARLEGEPDPKAAAARLLADFDLPDEQKPTANLSVGNRQRLNLAIALLGDPEVLLLDEPTAALDPEQRRRLWARAAEMRKAGGALVFATQNLDEVERVADRVAALRDGRPVFSGPVAEYEAESHFA
jgi:ABC-type multidrug transport system ATPase subunit